MNKYQINGKNKKLKIPYEISLDQINDISFAYKVTSKEKYKNLSDNFKRQLIYDKKIKKYVIKNVTYYLKEKKIRFLKELKSKVFQK